MVLLNGNSETLSTDSKVETFWFYFKPQIVLANEKTDEQVK